MGFFSSIWKGIKNVFKGILKIFQPILEPIAKFLDSDLGKAIMIGLSIFTLGTAMVAGYGAFSSSMAAGNGFISSFVEGGKVFLSTLTGIGGKEGAGQTAQVAGDAGAEVATSMAGAQGAQTNVNLLAGGEPGLAAAGANPAGSMAMGPGPTGDVMQRSVQAGGNVAGQGAMLPESAGGLAQTAGETARTGVPAVTTGAGGTSSAVAAAPETGGWLSKAARSAGEFLKSDSGGQIVGSLIQGAGNYYVEKDRQEFEDRIRRDWRRGTGDAGVAGIRESTARVGNLPSIQAQGRAGAGQPSASQQRPTFDRQYGAAAPVPAGG